VRGVEGDPCTTDAGDDCDFYNGVVCARTGTCVSATIGPMCGTLTDGSLVFCGDSAVCEMDNTCLPAADDTGACTKTAKGPNCVFPAFCGTDSHCHLPQPNRACGSAAPAQTGPRRALSAAGGLDAFWRAALPGHPAAED
jgi:hypothetical protein